MTESTQGRSGATLATVGAEYSDGVSLIFDGQDTASEKHYKCNASVSFAAGDRVVIVSISGSYVVLCKI